MQVLISILLAALFIFSLQQVVTTDLLAKLGQLSVADWVVLLFLPLLFFCTIYLYRKYKKDRLKQNEIFIAAAAAATFLLPVLLHFLNSESGIAIIVSTYFASVGWLYTNYNSIKNQRKSHTMTVLIQLRNSTEYHKHRMNIFKKFPVGKQITREDLTKLREERADPSSWKSENLPTIESMNFVLNYFEFMSIGVWNEDLDAAMIKESMRGIFKTWHQHLLLIITDTQKNSPRAFINFTRLVQLHDREATHL